MHYIFCIWHSCLAFMFNGSYFFLFTKTLQDTPGAPPPKCRCLIYILHQGNYNLLSTSASLIWPSNLHSTPTFLAELNSPG